MRTIIVVAGGSGTRFGGAIPKQFQLLDGRPILMRTIEVFHQHDASFNIILVLPEGQAGLWAELCAEYGFSVPYQMAFGGASRFESVWNGLQLAPDEGLIGIHDGVRPYIQPDTIDLLYHEAASKGNAIPAIAPPESTRLLTDTGNEIIDRNKIRLIQTPQVFDAKLIKTAYENAQSGLCHPGWEPRFGGDDIPGPPYTTAIYTDDASVLERDGHAIHLVPGHPANIKITFPTDIPPP